MSEIKYVLGDATHPQAEGPIIITHCCNNKRAWGAGFVNAITKRWGYGVRNSYKDRSTSMELGTVSFVNVGDNIWIANIIGQNGYGRNAKCYLDYSALSEGFAAVAAKANELGATVHMPRIGCGLAGGTWECVSSLILQELVNKGIDVTVYDLPSTTRDLGHK